MRRIALIQILRILLLIGRGEGCLPLFPPETTAPPPTTTAQPTCTEATTTSEGKFWFITVSTAALEVQSFVIDSILFLTKAVYLQYTIYGQFIIGTLVSTRGAKWREITN